MSKGQSKETTYVTSVVSVLDVKSEEVTMGVPEYPAGQPGPRSPMQSPTLGFKPGASERPPSPTLIKTSESGIGTADEVMAVSLRAMGTWRAPCFERCAPIASDQSR